MANTVTVADGPASGSLSVIDHFHVCRPHATMPGYRWATLKPSRFRCVSQITEARLSNAQGVRGGEFFYRVRFLQFITVAVLPRRCHRETSIEPVPLPRRLIAEGGGFLQGAHPCCKADNVL
jgi:hypothetical protein